MYNIQANTRTPGCILLLVDQSFSMTQRAVGSNLTLVEIIARTVNCIFGEIITKCEVGLEKPRSWFDVSLVRFTTDRNAYPVVCSGFLGGLADRDFVNVVEIYDHPADVEVRSVDDHAGGFVEIKFPVWYHAPVSGLMRGTPLCAALRYTIALLLKWCAAHPDSFPPIVVLFTDGESGDGDPEPLAERLRFVTTQNGFALLFICLLRASAARPVLLPVSEEQLPDSCSRSLFRMSSELPLLIRGWASHSYGEVKPGSRGMILDTGASSFVSHATKLTHLLTCMSGSEYNWPIRQDYSSLR